MAYYYEGYREARQQAETATLPEMICWIDCLLGRGNIEDITDIEQVRQELNQQIEREFTNATSKEYADAQFWGKIHAANKQYAR